MTSSYTYRATVVITRKIEITVPVDEPGVLYEGESPRDVAMEFAESMSSWGEYVRIISEQLEVEDLQESV